MYRLETRDGNRWVCYSVGSKVRLDSMGPHLEEAVEVEVVSAPWAQRLSLGDSFRKARVSLFICRQFRFIRRQADAKIDE